MRARTARPVKRGDAGGRKKDSTEPEREIFLEHLFSLLRRRPFASPIVPFLPPRGSRTCPSNRNRAQTRRDPSVRRFFRRSGMQFELAFILSRFLLLQKHTETARLARWPSTPSTWSSRNLQNVRGGKRDRGQQAPATAGEREGSIGLFFAREGKPAPLFQSHAQSQLGKKLNSTLLFLSKTSSLFFSFSCSRAPVP